MEDQSIRIVRDLLPDEWVVREYRPDYGIDLTVELFEYLDEKQTVAATLGETLFVQVKSIRAIEPRELRVFSRRNVERSVLRENRAKTRTLDVATLQLETSELLTVQAMSSAVPVLLLLVDLTTKIVYFVCLNDLIEKVILVEDPEYSEKQTKVLHIPLRNALLPDTPESRQAIEQYAKRPKLYAAFKKFGYQYHELKVAHASYLDSADESKADEAEQLIELIRHFLQIVLRYDFWERIPAWSAIRASYRELQYLADFLAQPEAVNDVARLRRFLLEQPFQNRNSEFYGGLATDEAQEHFFLDVVFLWSRLDNLSRIHEEMVREWFLPTYLSAALTPDLRDSRA